MAANPELENAASGDLTRVGVPAPDPAGECTIPPLIRWRDDEFVTTVAAGGETRRRDGSGLIIPLKLLLRASRNANVWLRVGTPDWVGVEARGGGEMGGLDFKLEMLSVLLVDRLGAFGADECECE